MMHEILKIYYKCKPEHEFTHVRLCNIDVLNCKSYPDCTYIETVKFEFELCDAHGAINGTNLHNRLILKFDIETGYIPIEIVSESLKQVLSKVEELKNIKIFRLTEIIEAFKYRRYYCHI